MAEVAEEHNIAFQEGMSAPQNTALTSQQAEQVRQLLMTKPEFSSATVHPSLTHIIPVFLRA
jgi:hypothetical protein